MSIEKKPHWFLASIYADICAHISTPHTCSPGSFNSFLLDPESSIPVSPNPNLSENLQQRKGTKKPSSIFGGCGSSSPEGASSPRPHLKWSAFGHTWAQTQRVRDTSSALAYTVYKLPVLVQVCNFPQSRSLRLEDLSGSSFAQINLFFYFSVLLGLTYCASGATYHCVTENWLAHMCVHM